MRLSAAPGLPCPSPLPSHRPARRPAPWRPPAPRRAVPVSQRPCPSPPAALRPGELAASLGSQTLAPLVQAHPQAADLLCLSLAVAGCAGGFALGHLTLGPAPRRCSTRTLGYLGTAAGLLLPRAADHPYGSICIFVLSLRTVDVWVGPSIVRHCRPQVVPDLLMLADLGLPVLLGAAALTVAR